MKLFKTRPIVSWITIAVFSLLLLFNTAIQIVCAGRGVFLPIVKLLVTVGLFVGESIYMRKAELMLNIEKNRWNTRLLVLAGICFYLIAVNVLEISDVPLYGILVLGIMVLLAVTAASHDSDWFSVVSSMWLVLMATTCILLIAKCYDAVFAINVIAVVIGVAYSFRFGGKLLRRIFRAAIVIAGGISVAMPAMLYSDECLEFVAGGFWGNGYYSHRVKLLNDGCYFGNLLMEAKEAFGMIVPIVIGALMLCGIVCAILLAKKKRGAALYLHIGATVAIAISFIGNLGYVLKIGNLFTDYAAFLSSNSVRLIVDVALLLCIVHQEPYDESAERAKMIKRVLDGWKANKPLDVKLHSVILNVEKEKDDIIKVFSSAKEDVDLIRNEKVLKEILGKEQALCTRIDGFIGEIYEMLSYIQLRCEVCVVRVVTSPDDIWYLDKDEIVDRIMLLPPDSAISITINDFQEEGIFTVAILCA